MKNINFDLSKAERAEAWDFLTKELEVYYAETGVLPVSPGLDKNEIKNYVHQSFANPLSIENAIEHFTISNSPIRLLNAQVSLEPLPAAKKYYYGNIGQDVIKQFDIITINFLTSSISFIKNKKEKK